MNKEELEFAIEEYCSTQPNCDNCIFCIEEPELAFLCTIIENKRGR